MSVLTYAGVLSLIALIVPIWEVQSEVFTAVADIEPLLETHKRITDDLDAYLEKEEKRLTVLKRHLEIYKKEYDKAMEDIPNYLGNPIHAFTLIKRLTTDLDKLEYNIQIGTEYIKNITMTVPDVKYPSTEDLTGAAQALTRLQQTYDLRAKDLSEGIINGITYSNPMSSSDCFELGRSLYDVKEYHNALPWFMESLRKYEDIEYNGFKEVDLLEYVAFSHYLMGELEQAVEWTEKVLEKDPLHPRAIGNVPHFKKAIIDKEDRIRRRNRGETGDHLVEEEYVKNKYWNTEERVIYEALCRGEMTVPDNLAKQLKCSYVTETHPFLKIAPIKMEQMYIKPDVFVFHQVMTDDEIEHIQNAAKPRFQRAVVHNPETGALESAPYRISKSAWLKDEESETIATVSRRVADMTGLNMMSAEELQVVNYGIGGHYEPHFDFSRRVETEAFHNFLGNRIATVLFYMSDVAQGGATVFTELGLSVFPIKGAALFWMNLHPSGEGDFATRHAACPVLRGSKWVSNKWIHQGGQEFLKPCNLVFQDEGIIGRLPIPIRKTSR